MNNRIYRIMLGGVIILNMLGFLMDVVWIQGTGNAGFFAWDIKYRGHIPYWLFANIVFLSVTLTACFFFTGAQFHITSGHENNKSKLLIKILGVNLILIPTILALFLLISSDEITHGKLMNVLLNKRVVYLEGEVTQTEAERIGRAIMLLNAQDDSKEITFYIYSYGGSVMSGLDIYDVIRHSKSPVTCIVKSRALSIATVILQACNTRKAMEHSYLLIHNIEISGKWHELEENLKEELEDVKKDQQKINRLLAERSGLTVEEIAKLSGKGKLLRPDEAKKFGLIDEVIYTSAL